MKLGWVSWRFGKRTIKQKKIEREDLEAGESTQDYSKTPFPNTHAGSKIARNYK